jgi:hypothetical protein
MRRSFVDWGGSVNRARVAGVGETANAARMSEETLASAMARIERAVGRLEQAVQTRAAGSSGLAESYAALEERHSVLRARIQETIDRLDHLIEDGAR